MESKIYLLIAEYNSIRAELLKCNQNAHSILNWSFPIIATLFIAGLFTASNQNFLAINFLYYLIVLPLSIVSIETVWFGEIVRQQRAEKYLFELEKRINNIVKEDSNKENKLYWHHWLRKTPEEPIEGLQFSHYRNIAISYLFFIFFSHLISVLFVFQINISILAKFFLLPTPFLFFFIAVKWLDYLGSHYFDYQLIKRLINILLKIAKRN